MRRDAEEHRARLLAAATRVFSRSGCAVPLEIVLLEADLGRGTLYRHFKTRGDLVAAVLTAELDRMVSFVEERRMSPSLFRDFLQEHAPVGMMAVSAMQTVGDAKASEILAALNAKAGRLYDTVIADAVAVGTVREPFGKDDLIFVMRMVIAAASQDETEEARRRSISRGLDIMLHGLPSGTGSK